VVLAAVTLSDFEARDTNVSLDSRYIHPYALVLRAVLQVLFYKHILKNQIPAQWAGSLLYEQFPVIYS
jgi:hypothetical protein